MATIARRAAWSRGRRAPSNFELYTWFFMRVSGLVLLFMAVFHLLYMHFVVGLEKINFKVIAERWDNPGWRIFDFLLLAFALLHGLNGGRTIIEDYVRSPGRLVFSKALLYVIGFALMAMGALIIFTFQNPMR